MLSAFDINITILLMILSYILGSIPFGILVSKYFCHKDIRNYGSHNIGSTNAVRVLGKKYGALVFLFDVLKGMAVILLVKLLSVTNIWHCPDNIDLILFGLPAVIGHCYSIFLNFSGGKAVATSLGVIMILSPLAGILCLVAFVITLVISGYVSLASTAATLTVLITNWVLYFVGIEGAKGFMFLFAQPTLTTSILYILLAFVIISKHTKNYIRLFNGTENSFKNKK